MTSVQIEGDAHVVEREKAAVRDRHAVGVAREASTVGSGGRLVEAGLLWASGQQTFERRRQRDLNRGCDKRPDFNSARHTIDNALEPPFDLVGQFCRSHCDLRLGRADKFSPFRFSALPKHLGRRIDKRRRRFS